MPRLRMVATVLVMTAAVAGCGGGGGDGDIGAAAPGTTAAVTTVPVPTTSPGTTLPAADLTLRITNLQLVSSEESDNGVRVLLPGGVSSASVTVTGVPTPNRVVSVCQASDLDRRLSAAACRMPGNGESVTVALGSAASGVEIVQVGVSGSGATANTTTLGEVTIRYAASLREVNARLPQIAGGESGPSFGLTPAGASGAYKAMLTWSVIQAFGGTSSNGQLELLQGGSPTNRAEGAGLDVRLNGTVSPPVADVAVRVQNIGAGALVSPKLNLLLP